MKNDIPPFSGFSGEIFKFLLDLKKNNKLEWFQANRKRYQSSLVLPAKGFVNEMAPFFNRLNLSIRTEPKFNETLMRLNKDMRFSKGEPYRPFLLVHFGRFKLDSEFYIYFEPDNFSMGMFINRSDEENLFFRKNQVKYAKEIINVFDRYKINDNYSLSYLGKETELVHKKFSALKHYQSLENHNYLLLEKVKKPSLKVLNSQNIIIEMIKMVSQLYPIYCFAISAQPLKELQKFEDNFGEII